jgi:3',5'-cyclic AMP phosphodiesterase CpdA
MDVMTRMIEGDHGTNQPEVLWRAGCRIISVKKKKLLLGRPATWVLAMIVMASCEFSGSDDEPLLFITATPAYVSVQEGSCIRLNMQTSDLWQSSPWLKSSLGTIENLEPVEPGRWEADLCPGDETGRVYLEAENYEIVAPLSLYFIPPMDSLPSDPVTVTAFSANIDPLNQTVEFTAIDILDAYSIELAVYLYGATPFTFEGNTVGLAVIIEGTGTPWDLLEVRAYVDMISLPEVVLANPDGYDPYPGGDPYFYYGGIMATDRALEIKESPTIWGMPWYFQSQTDRAFTISGSVRAWLSKLEDEQADFRIRPFLTKASTDSITVSWETDCNSRSFVVYGPTPECEHVAGGTTELNMILEGYAWDQAPYFDSFFHRVEVTGIEPHSWFYYRVIAVQEPTFPEEFITAAPPGQTFSFGVIGDTQCGPYKDQMPEQEEHKALIAQMILHPLDFYLHTGDLVQKSWLESQWLTFFNIEAPLLKNRPIFPTLGNHDVDRISTFYNRYFDPDSPYGDSGLLKGRMYSFDYGNSHFAAIDTDLSVLPDSPQYLWLSQDLAMAQADPNRKFTFVFEHRPAVSAYPHGQYYGQTFLLPLYQAHDVDAVFSGHVHLYERSDVDGRIYIVNGGGGVRLLYEESPQPRWMQYYVFSSVVHHFIRVDVGNDGFVVYAIDNAGTIIDEVHYSKP